MARKNGSGERVVGDDADVVLRMEEGRRRWRDWSGVLGWRDLIDWVHPGRRVTYSAILTSAARAVCAAAAAAGLVDAGIEHCGYD